MSNRSDLERYREMSAPHASMAEFADAVSAFGDVVEQARVDNKLADVLVVIRSPVVAADGTVGAVMTTWHIGDSLLSAHLAAYAYGQAEQEQKEVLAKLLAGKAGKAR